MNDASTKCITSTTSGRGALAVLVRGLARFAITKRQLRQPTLDLLERHAEDTRADILHVWKDPNTHAAIRAYLDATLGKEASTFET